MKLKIETITNKKKTIKIIICDEFIIYEGAKRIAASASIKEKILDDEFEEFWQAYPRKEGKKNAYASYNKYDIENVVLIDAIAKHKESDDWKNGYIPHATTWLNVERWEVVVYEKPNQETGMEQAFREYDEKKAREK